jgi:Fe-S cluster assembly protein SufD
MTRPVLSKEALKAAEKFLESGFPTTRDEDWKYTDLSGVANLGRSWLHGGARSADGGVQSQWMSEFAQLFERQGQLIIQNGTRASAIENGLPEGLLIAPLSATYPEPDAGTPLATLNSTLLDDGLHIVVEPGFRSERPFYILAFDTFREYPGVSQSRIVIDVSAGAEFNVVEINTSHGKAEHYQNSIIEFNLAATASVDHVQIHKLHAQNSQTHATSVRLAESSRYRHTSFDLGGRLVRNDLNIDIAGRDALADVAGLYIAGPGDHIDNHVRIDHRVGPARSSQEYRGVLDGKCRCVWNGKAMVREGADGTDAEQGNHNLLLSDQAEIDAKPELEIYADEVKCSHGTTVGQLDDDALFYLRTRGLDQQEARVALTHAFGAGVINRIAQEDIRERVSKWVELRYQQISAGGTP